MVFMDYIFCISEKNKFIMLLCIALLQSCSFNERTSGNILLQNNEQSSIVVDIKRIAVCLGQLADRDSVPVSIIFFVSVNNQTDHNFIFDSSTDFYFREIADKRYGEFWMIHSRDSLMLSSHMLGVPIVKSRNSIMFDPQINDIDYEKDSFINYFLGLHRCTASTRTLFCCQFLSGAQFRPRGIGL